MEQDKSYQYVYIVQSSKEQNVCKIGKTNDFQRRLKDYNNMTGKSKDNIYRCLFLCEVGDMTQVEKDIKTDFSYLREQKNKEIYFYNNELLEKYVKFIKSHKLFIKEINIENDDNKIVIKYIKQKTPSLKERGLSPKDLLQKAQKAQNDEFYTRYEDIEKEVSMYDKSVWKDKTVLCNCDDAVDETDNKNSSAFALFFIRNFNELGLKKLICIHYGGGWDIFNQGAQGYVAYISFTTDGEKIYKEFPKNYNGSFDHPLSLKILNEEADIVCTNPPFSRMIDYWKIVIKSGKKFLIISNITNVVTNAFIPYFYDNKVWGGHNRVDAYLDDKKRLVDAAGHWYTNLPIYNRQKYEHLKIMSIKEIPEKYKKYDDSKILLIDNCYIPSNLKTTFAVSARPILNGLLEKGYKLADDKEYYPYINGKKKFARVLVQKI
jgi:predicted GIY-YIG superfamily endonuclease